MQFLLHTLECYINRHTVRKKHCFDTKSCTALKNRETLSKPTYLSPQTKHLSTKYEYLISVGGKSIVYPSCGDLGLTSCTCGPIRVTSGWISERSGRGTAGRHRVSPPCACECGCLCWSSCWWRTNRQGTCASSPGSSHLQSRLPCPRAPANTFGLLFAQIFSRNKLKHLNYSPSDLN